MNAGPAYRAAGPAYRADEPAYRAAGPAYRDGGPDVPKPCRAALTGPQSPLTGPPAFRA